MANAAAAIRAASAARELVNLSDAARQASLENILRVSADLPTPRPRDSSLMFVEYAAAIFEPRAVAMEARRAEPDDENESAVSRAARQNLRRMQSRETGGVVHTGDGRVYTITTPSVFTVDPAQLQQVEAIRLQMAFHLATDDLSRNPGIVVATMNDATGGASSRIDRAIAETPLNQPDAMFAHSLLLATRETISGESASDELSRLANANLEMARQTLQDANDATKELTQSAYHARRDPLYQQLKTRVDVWRGASR